MSSARRHREQHASGARETGDTGQRILDVAERFVQSRGFNGFSYGDVAAELGVTTAALHYHFPGKAELGVALVNRYAERFMAALAALQHLADPVAALSSYAQLYLDVLQDRRMCLCGMLAAEYQTLPPAMRHAVIAFFDENEAWLVSVLDDGRAAGRLQFDGSSRETARMIVGGLEGTMLVARAHDDPDRFRTSAAQLLANLVRSPERDQMASGRKPAQHR